MIVLYYRKLLEEFLRNILNFQLKNLFRNLHKIPFNISFKTPLKTTFKIFVIVTLILDFLYGGHKYQFEDS